MDVQADHGGVGSGLVSGAAPARIVLNLGLGQVIAAIPRHRAG